MRCGPALKALVTIVLVAVLTSCASLGRSPGAGNYEQNPWADLPPYEWPPFQQSYAEDLNLGPAQRALLQEADAHYEQGRAGASAAALERALRLAPRSPVLWYRLASLRASQGDYAASNRLSEKARSLTNADSSLRLQSWLNWLNQWLLNQLSPQSSQQGI